MTTTTAIAEIDRIERSFIANIDRGEQALEAAEDDYRRLEIRDAARAAQVVTAVMGRRKLVRRFSVLVQRAERAIAQAHPPMSKEETGVLSGQAKNGEYTAGDYLNGGVLSESTPPLTQKELQSFRAAHSRLSDDEFEEMANEDTDEPMTRTQLIELAKEKRDEERPEQREQRNGQATPHDDEDGFDPDVVEGAIDTIGDQVRDIIAQLPDKSDRVLDIVRETLLGLEKRLLAYPRNSARMEAKFEQLREMQERGVIPYTVWDFPFRDDYAGDKEYHGNCSPQIVEQCVWRLTDEGDMVIDPMVGSGTTIDVCARYNRRVAGYDLNPVRDDIAQADARHLPATDESARPRVHSPAILRHGQILKGRC